MRRDTTATRPRSPQWRARRRAALHRRVSDGGIRTRVEAATYTTRALPHAAQWSNGAHAENRTARSPRYAKHVETDMSTRPPHSAPRGGDRRGCVTDSRRATLAQRMRREPRACASPSARITPTLIELCKTKDARGSSGGFITTATREMCNAGDSVNERGCVRARSAT